MEQVTTLRLAIDSRDAVKAQKDLDNLAKSSTVTEKAASGLSRAIGAIGFAAMAAEAIKTADAMNRLDGRLRLATESTAEYTAQWKELADVAERSRSGLSETITLFTKLNPAVKQLGGDTAATNKIVEAFSKSLKVGGASSAESASAILQFAQAMGSGVLRGEEFNAIFEASAKTMDYLAKGMGVPVTEMRKLAQEGELTAGKVAAAMLKMTEQINTDFGTIPLTVGDALTQAKNELAIFILETDKSLGVTQALAGGITGSVEALKSAVGVYQEYSSVINGAAVTAGVFLAANKAAAVTEAALAAIRARNTVTTTAYDAALMRTVTTTTTLTTAQTLSAAAAGAMGTALKAVPFLAVAGIVTALAASFFDAKSKSDDLNDSLNATAESLGKLTKAQLEYKRTNLSLELQSVGLELRQLQQEYGATGKRTAEQQKEIDDLRATYNQLREASVQVAAAQTALREGKKASASATQKENKAIEEQIKLLEKNGAAAVKAPKQKKEKSEVDDIVKAQKDALQDNADRESDLALSVYNAKLQAQQDYFDKEAQLALDVYTAEQEAIQASADLRSSLALQFFEMTQSETQKINDANLAIWEANQGLFQEDQMQGFFQRWQEAIDGVKGGYAEITSEIDALRPTSKDWTAGLTGQAKAVANVLNATLDLSNANKKVAKEREKINSSKELTASQKAIKLDELKTVELESQYTAYSNLAGAMASAFEQGSEGAIAFTALQSALGIASSWAAIAEAWALGFPQNIPAVAAVTAAVMPIISQLGGSGGGGGGQVRGGQKGVDYAYNKSMIDTSYAPITDRLDRQISLLESIDKQGSAAALGVIASGVSFQRDIQKWTQDVLSQSVQGALGIDGSTEATQQIVDQFNSAFGKNLYTVRGDNIYADYSMLQSSSDVITALITSVNTGVAGIFGLLEDYQKIKFESQSTKLIRVVSELNDLQNIIGDWASGIMESMDDLKSASKDFKGYFDEITGTTFYETARLNQAYSEVAKLTGEQSLADYLQNTISDIDALQSFFTQDTYTLLMSNNLEDIQAQMDALEQLSQITGQTFDQGAREALDYLESIQLVSEAMATSRKNTDSFLDSLRTDSDKLILMAASSGNTVATSVNGLAELFNKLANDADGLTDSDLALLEANKDMLANTDDMQKQVDSLNSTLTDTTSKISSLSNTLSTVQSIIDKLRSPSLTSSQSLSEFWDALRTAKELAGGTDYEAFANAVKRVSDASGVLTNSAAFNSAEEMAFAQQLAAIQLEDIQDSTLTQIDYLKQIEVNTRTQISVLVEAMRVFGANLNSSLLSLIDKFETESNLTGITGDIDAINAVYQKTLGRSAESAGAMYWQNALNTGTITEGTLGQSVIAGAVSSGELTREQAISQLYVGGLGRAPDQAGLDYWVNSGIPVSDLPALMGLAAAGNGEVYTPFKNGGYTGDMGVNTPAGIVHGREFVINAPTTQKLGLNKDNGGVFVQMANELSAVRSELSAIKQMQITQTTTQIKTLSTQNAILSNVST